MIIDGFDIEDKKLKKLPKEGDKVTVGGNSFFTTKDKNKQKVLVTYKVMVKVNAYSKEKLDIEIDKFTNATNEYAMRKEVRELAKQRFDDTPEEPDDDE